MKSEDCDAGPSKHAAASTALDGAAASPRWACQVRPPHSAHRDTIYRDTQADRMTACAEDTRCPRATTVQLCLVAVLIRHVPRLIRERVHPVPIRPSAVPASLAVLKLQVRCVMYRAAHAPRPS